jgi:class 3 adenylate cyclase
MRYPEFRYRWEWRLQASPEALWPLVSDTNRFNRDTDVPAIERRNQAALPNARRRLRFYRLGIVVEWEEEPFEWVYPFRFGVVRRYSSGPVGELRTLTELVPQLDGGTRLVYKVWARPRNPLGLIAIPVQIGVISARNFARVFRRYDHLAVEGKSALDLPGEVKFAPGGQKRLAELHKTLLSEGASEAIAERLIAAIEQSDSMTAARLRPYALADHWGMDRRAVLEHCLLSTSIGLLEFQWDVLCPLCGGTKHSTPKLGGIRPEVHCDTCNIDFAVNFDRAVELTFRPNPAIREVEKSEFCIAGPQTTPRVVAQQLLPAGDTRTITPALEPGRYRVRTLALRGGEYLQVVPNGLSEVVVRADSYDGWPEEEVQLAPEPTLHFKNITDSEQLFILERMAWSDQAVTAADVTTMQLFRNLFAREALRPGEQISVGSLTVVFTDLRGSTRLYTEIGDAPAFGLVMEHFDVLRDAINDKGGAIVKTIGDAVMAVFRRPAPALRAMLHAQQALAQQGKQPLRLKVGIHYGPCIAVTLNDRLDYFGSTVNIAARLEGFSSGRDVVISDAVRADPEVAELLSDSACFVESFAATLKGYDDSAFELWRVGLAVSEVEWGAQTLKRATM